MQSQHETSDAGPKLVNRLHLSKSPYVRAHMNNPVAWQLWDSEAVNHAKKYNRMIFLSIGYSACHWCHVMEKESFMSAEVAAILNESFIPIKVDREERPDIDDIYMNYVQATTGSGGWPLNVFLTPELEPVFGGTYWPGPNSSTSHGPGTTGFVEILEKLRDVWSTQQERCLESAKDITTQLREFAEEGTHSQATGQEEDEEDLDVELLEEAYQHFASRYDSINGGFGRAPKFPTPANLAFLLRLGAYPEEVRDVIGKDECEKATAMAVTTLVNMARGGIRDHIGHGFSRYSVTADWSLPHFEKMLYDQAQLLDVYLDAFRLTHDPELLGAVYDLAAYLTTAPLQSPTGGFFSSEDADSYPSPNDTEKREGAFYVWSLKELNQVLGSRDAPVCARHWGILPDGNVAAEYDPHDEFMNQNVLSVKATPSKLAKEFGLSEEEVVRIIKNGKQKLRDHRERTRGHPDLDDKIVVAWNGLAIGALAKCSVLFEDIESSKATSCRETAARAVSFIKENLFERSTGKLWRIWRDGSRGDTPGFADDYAFLTSGLLDMYEATFDDSYLQFAERLQKYLNEHFLSKTETSSSGYFNTSSELTPGMPGPLFRLKTGTESATPSVNAVIARNLLRLAALLKEEQYRTLARQTCNSFAVEILQHPFLFVGLLDVVVGLQIGTRTVTGVFSTTETGPGSSRWGESSQGREDQPVAARDLIVRRVRAEAGAGPCPTLAVTSMVDIRPSHLKDFVGNQSFWLKSRNPLFKDLKAGEHAKNQMMICDSGRCNIVDLE
ncbi:Spermatogenesis-associated protein 20 [Penicillium ucsense]|uniref:Spermatogenesis-associated protein 20 n=1 Tax=Penicillium ucsense TaxID=2839758 RepID=A0A8J8W2V9_9EURO|nr:Spermatogenesis-associated protein 20 [Penicillium ucsense]KAF7731366.1 Spermatogenesis-associated protein 20 [Penicillium ucsense]